MCRESSFFIKSNLHRDLRCPICLGILCLNSVTDKCDHTFCKSCIYQWIKRGKSTCPIGNEAILLEELKPIIRILRNLLSDLELHCKYLDLGCNEIAKYEKITQHEAICLFNSNANLNSLAISDKNFALNVNKVLSSRTITLPGTVYRMVLWNETIIMTDGSNGVLYICNLDGKLIDTINPDGELDQPCAICIYQSNNKYQLLVGDFSHQKVLVFDINYNFIRKFGNENIIEPQSMSIDYEVPDDRQKLLYVSDIVNNVVTVWSVDNGQMTDKLNIDTPFTIKFSIDKMFIESPAYFELDENTPNKLKKIKKGSNCIFILDKFKYEVLNEVKFSNWLTPSALHVDCDMNMYTIAYELDDNQIKSHSKYLFMIDKDGKNIQKKIYLDNVNRINDVAFLPNKLFIVVDNQLIIITLE